jgi:hypothetical protein
MFYATWGMFVVTGEPVAVMGGGARAGEIGLGVLVDGHRYAARSRHLVDDSR